MTNWNTNPATNEGDQELQLIPRWSIALAIVVFMAVQWLFHTMPRSHHDSPALRILWGYSWGTALASYVLLIGYVSRDVKRRAMSAKLWLLLVVVMPGGIGAVVYFLLRQPILSRCPNCSTQINASCNFCPQCQFQLAPVCGRCFRDVNITDVFCKQCGHDITTDDVPARLKAYHP